jgi:hypothetical protein
VTKAFDKTKMAEPLFPIAAFPASSHHWIWTRTMSASEYQQLTSLNVGFSATADTEKERCVDPQVEAMAKS